MTLDWSCRLGKASQAALYISEHVSEPDLHSLLFFPHTFLSYLSLLAQTNPQAIEQKL